MGQEYPSDISREQFEKITACSHKVLYKEDEK